MAKLHIDIEQVGDEVSEISIKTTGSVWALLVGTGAAISQIAEHIGQSPLMTAHAAIIANREFDDNGPSSILAPLEVIAELIATVRSIAEKLGIDISNACTATEKVMAEALKNQRE